MGLRHARLQVKAVNVEIVELAGIQILNILNMGNTKKYQRAPKKYQDLDIFVAVHVDGETYQDLNIFPASTWTQKKYEDLDILPEP